MKILITGSSGFVGKYLVRKLSKKYKIITYDLVKGQNVLNTKLLAKKLEKVDLAIHLAAFISASESWEKPKQYFENNALGTLSVVKACISAKVPRLIFFSSAAVKARPLTPYAISKMTAENIVDLYKDRLKTIVVRPENIYGIGQKKSYGYVIHNFIASVVSNKPVEIYGDGWQERDFIYIDDVVNVIEKLILSDKYGEIISLGTGISTKIIDLAKIIGKILHKEVVIKKLEKRTEPRKSIGNPRSLTFYNIPKIKFTSLEKGIIKLKSN